MGKCGIKGESGGRSQLKLKGANKEMPFRPSTETDKLKVAEDIH